MADHIITTESDEISAAEIQSFAARNGWGGVSPLTQQLVRFRHTMIDAVVQKRGPVFFAVAFSRDGAPHFVGPRSQKIDAAKKAVEAALSRVAAA